MDNPKPTRAKRGQTEPVRVEPEGTVGDVRRAAAVLKGAVLNTDFDHSRTLSDMLGCRFGSSSKTCNLPPRSRSAEH